MSQLLLAADVGNSAVTMALFRNARRVRIGQIDIEDLANRRRAAAWLVKTFRRHLTAKATAIVGSVNPPAAARLESLLKSFLKTKPLLIGRDLEVPVRNRARKPKEVGTDRLLNTLAAYQETRSRTIVVDYGTCITFDIISAKGDYLGGIITPGHRLIATALAEGTALLPEVRTTKRPPLIGRDTGSAIRSGTFYGIASTVDGILQRLLKEHGKSRVIATGGHARVFASHSPLIETVLPGLTLEGLRLTYGKHRGD